jgi:thiamine biosynthesis lipoprotein ApbE
MITDALSTAAFVMGPEQGRDFLAAQGLEALIIDSALLPWQTDGFGAYLQ